MILFCCCCCSIVGMSHIVKQQSVLMNERYLNEKWWYETRFDYTYEFYSYSDVNNVYEKLVHVINWSGQIETIYSYDRVSAGRAQIYEYSPVLNNDVYSFVNYQNDPHTFFNFDNQGNFINA